MYFCRDRYLPPPPKFLRILVFWGGGSKCVLFLSETYVIVFVSVTYIFTITGTYHLPRGITFAPQALGVPRGGGFSSKNAKQQGAAFYGGGPGKTSSLVFTASCHKKDTDVVRVFAFLELAERGGFEPPEPIRVQRFSRPPRSTAPASLRLFWCKSNITFPFPFLWPTMGPAMGPAMGTAMGPVMGLAKVRILFIFWRKICI